MESIKQALSGNSFDSPLEKKLFLSLREFGLIAKPRYPFEIFLIDLAFSHQKLAIEVDGFKFHISEERQIKDRYKDERLKKSGWIVERFDGWFVYRYSNVVAAKIALRYFENELKQEQKDHAIGLIAGFFASRQPEITEALLKQYE